jgi:hypothetical protein
MRYSFDIPESEGFNAHPSPLIRSMDLIFSKFFHFSCPISTTDSALLYRR